MHLIISSEPIYEAEARVFIVQSAAEETGRCNMCAMRDSMTLNRETVAFLDLTCEPRRKSNQSSVRDTCDVGNFVVSLVLRLLRKR